MSGAKNLIEEVRAGSDPVKVMQEFIDDRDAVNAIMLVIKNESKLYHALMKGTMQPKQAATEGTKLYLKSLQDTIKDDVSSASVQQELQRQIASWISTVRAGR